MLVVIVIVIIIISCYYWPSWPSSSPATEMPFPRLPHGRLKQQQTIYLFLPDGTRPHRRGFKGSDVLANKAETITRWTLGLLS